MIVEDHLSAIRVRRHFNVLCLSGTTLSHKVIHQILDDFSIFIFWLDADEPGQKATYKNLARLKWNSSAYNVECMFLDREITEHQYLKVDHHSVTKDPKKYLDYEIINILTNQVRTA